MACSVSVSGHQASNQAALSPMFWFASLHRDCIRLAESYQLPPGRGNVTVR